MNCELFAAGTMTRSLLLSDVGQVVVLLGAGLCCCRGNSFIGCGLGCFVAACLSSPSSSNEEVEEMMQKSATWKLINA